MDLEKSNSRPEPEDHCRGTSLFVAPLPSRHPSNDTFKFSLRRKFSRTPSSRSALLLLLLYPRPLLLPPQIKSFQIPLEEIEHVMRAVFLLLGDAPSEISAWKGIKVAIGRTGKKSLKRRILEFVPSNPLPKASLVQARKLMDGVAVDRITEVSQGTTVFYAWVSGVLDEMANKS